MFEPTAPFLPFRFLDSNKPNHQENAVSMLSWPLDASGWYMIDWALHKQTIVRVLHHNLTSHL